LNTPLSSIIQCHIIKPAYNAQYLMRMKLSREDLHDIIFNENETPIENSLVRHPTSQRNPTSANLQRRVCCAREQRCPLSSSGMHVPNRTRCTLAFTPSHAIYRLPLILSQPPLTCLTLFVSQPMAISFPTRYSKAMGVM
jgi:hypothetical protein